jgi:hypothetical protein
MTHFYIKLLLRKYNVPAYLGSVEFQKKIFVEKPNKELLILDFFSSEIKIVFFI